MHFLHCRWSPETSVRVWRWSCDILHFKVGLTALTFSFKITTSPLTIHYLHPFSLSSPNVTPVPYGFLLGAPSPPPSSQTHTPGCRPVSLGSTRALWTFLKAPPPVSTGLVWKGRWAARQVSQLLNIPVSPSSSFPLPSPQYFDWKCWVQAFGLSPSCSSALTPMVVNIIAK